MMKVAYRICRTNTNVGGFRSGVHDHETIDLSSDPATDCRDPRDILAEMKKVALDHVNGVIPAPTPPSEEETAAAKMTLKRAGFKRVVKENGVTTYL